MPALPAPTDLCQQRASATCGRAGEPAILPTSAIRTFPHLVVPGSADAAVGGDCLSVALGANVHAPVLAGAGVGVRPSCPAKCGMSTAWPIIFESLRDAVGGPPEISSPELLEKGTAAIPALTPSDRDAAHAPEKHRPH